VNKNNSLLYFFQSEAGDHSQSQFIICNDRSSVNKCNKIKKKTSKKGKTVINGAREIIAHVTNIPGDSGWYSRPDIFFILRKKYSKPYIHICKSLMKLQ
jgi:hypothetical protein